MKNYRQYNVEDFITDAEFVNWVRDCHPAGEVFWNTWLQNNPDKKEIVEEARLLLLSLKTEERHSGKEELDQQVRAVRDLLGFRDSRDGDSCIARRVSAGLASTTRCAREDTCSNQISNVQPLLGQLIRDLCIHRCRQGIIVASTKNGN